MQLGFKGRKRQIVTYTGAPFRDHLFWPIGGRLMQITLTNMVLNNYHKYTYSGSALDGKRISATFCSLSSTIMTGDAYSSSVLSSLIVVSTVRTSWPCHAVLNTHPYATLG